jgi:hypothetical protein
MGSGQDTQRDFSEALLHLLNFGGGGPDSGSCRWLLLATDYLDHVIIPES